ncbi:recombinase family protein [Epibacterium ulvae]|uniref:recombinase family protein n=1 Tax=Epibacterium ulvae TaxID=1156985 RepID=UPI002492122B|nr:recombinase family protein [Epibacterium ulvae]
MTRSIFWSLFLFSLRPQHLPSSVAQRAELENVLKFVRRKDTLVVTKLDRLARSTQHLPKIVEGLEAKGVALRILDFGGAEVDTKSPSGKLMLTMFAAMAQFEREMMLERQREGIHKAKQAGKYKGRASVQKQQVETVIEELPEALNTAVRKINVTVRLLTFLGKSSGTTTVGQVNI